MEVAGTLSRRPLPPTLGRLAGSGWRMRRRVRTLRSTRSGSTDRHRGGCPVARAAGRIDFIRSIRWRGQVTGDGLRSPRNAPIGRGDRSPASSSQSTRMARDRSGSGGWATSFRRSRLGHQLGKNCGVVDAGVLLVRPDRGSVGAVYGTRCCVGVSPTWSPNGTRLAFFGGDASAGYAAGVAQPRRSHATIFKHFAGAVFAPTWSRNGAKLAFVGCNDRDVCWLYVSDRDGHRIARVPDSQVRFVKALAWAP